MTVYSEEINFWTTNQPTFATVEGFLELGGISQAVPNNGYGLDIRFLELSKSPDWDIVAVSGISGSTGGQGGDVVFNNVEVRGQLSHGENALVDGPIINTNCNDGNVHTVTLGGDRTLAAPTEQKAGASYLWKIKQDITGNRLLTLDAVFKPSGQVTIPFSTDPNVEDWIQGVSDGTNIGYTLIKNFLIP